MSRTTRHKATPQQERLWCDCGGEMIFDGSIKPMYPPLYCHKCELCNKSEDIRNKQYPRIIWTIEDKPDE